MQADQHFSGRRQNRTAYPKHAPRGVVRRGFRRPQTVKGLGVQVALLCCRRPPPFIFGWTWKGRSSVLVARDAASRVGTVHHEIIVHPSALKELLPAVVKILGKPGGNIRTCLHYALWREAAEYVQKLFVAHTARTLCNGAVVASGDQTDEPTTQKMLAKTLGLELHFLSIGREMLPPTIGGPNSPQVGDRNISARSVVETSTGKNGLGQYRKTLADALSELADTYLAGPTLLRTAIDKHVIDDLKRSDCEPYDEKRFRNLWEAVTAEVWARQCAAVRSRGVRPVRCNSGLLASVAALLIACSMRIYLRKPGKNDVRSPGLRYPSRSDSTRPCGHTDR
ncbi:asparagine synthase-related protein [Rhizobium beringeri]